MTLELVTLDGARTDIKDRLHATASSETDGYGTMPLTVNQSGVYATITSLAMQPRSRSTRPIDRGYQKIGAAMRSIVKPLRRNR